MTTPHTNNKALAIEKVGEKYGNAIAALGETRTATDTRKEILEEMNAGRKDGRTYIDSDWLLSKYETALRKDWLRSEIEKLEGETEELVTLNCYGNCNPRCHDSGKDIALTSIITRYKKELKVLENK